MNEVLEIVTTWLEALPTWVLAIIVLVLGLILARLLLKLIPRFLRLIRFDKASERTGFSAFLRTGKVNYSPSQLIGIVLHWVTLLITLFYVSRLLDISAVTSWITQLVDITPSILSAALVIIIGVVVVSFIGNFTLTVARNAAVPHSDLIARLVKIVGVVLVVGVAIGQLGINLAIINSLLLIVSAAVALGLALAFGLGCKDMARDAMRRFLSRLRERDRDGGGSDLEG